MNVKVSDYVFDYLYKQGIKTAFMLSGGGIMHLVDSLGSSSMEYVCCHHEQAASIAAQAYSMFGDSLGLCLATTGPGGTNAITGCAAAYVDSTPVIYMTGQVKRSDFASLRGVRQFGAQENDIIPMVRPITKYAVLVTDPYEIAYELEKVCYIAMHGRKGPCWIDIPLDVQDAVINTDELKHFNPEEHDNDCVCPDLSGTVNGNLDQTIIDKVVDMIFDANRPVLLIGQGAVASKSYDIIRKIIEMTKIPVLATWRALDFMGTMEDGFYGSPGLQAPRYSNIILQNSDLLIVLGSRLDNMITAFNEEHFAYKAKKVIVDIDYNEIKKLNMSDKMSVNSDVGCFVRALYDSLKDVSNDKKNSYTKQIENWCRSCNILKEKYPILKEKQIGKAHFSDFDDNDNGAVDLYNVTGAISDFSLDNDTIVISSTSRCNTAGHIAFNHKRGQKTISSMGMGSMGFAIPSAIGAYYANGNNRVVVIEGDGSLQLNIQELQTIKAYGIDAKIFIFDNNGYAAITTMQERNFDGHYVGSNSKSGVTMPNTEKISSAYEIPFYKINDACDAVRTVKEVMEKEGPVICSIKGSLWFDEIPKCISFINQETGKRESALLENPYPFLSEDEMKDIENIIYNELSES